MRLLPLALLIAAMPAGAAAAQEPPPLTPEQQEKLRDRPKLKEAIANFEAVLKKCRSVLGETHPDTLLLVERIATLQEEVYDYASARKSWADLLALRTTVFGKDHWKTTDARLGMKNAELMAGLTAKQIDLLNNDKVLRVQAISLCNEGRYAEAIPLCEKMVKIRREIYGEKHREYARRLMDMAEIYDSQGLYTKSASLRIDVLRINREILGEMHPGYAASLNSLGWLYHTQGHYVQAEPLLLEAFRIRKEVLGEKHLDYSKSLMSIAALYYAQGQCAKAEPLLLDAVRLLKDVREKEPLEYAGSLESLAILYHYQGQYAKAEPLLQESLRIFRDVRGEKHPDYANSLKNMAMLYAAQGRYGKAEPLILDALRIRKEILGDRHPDYASSLSGLGLLYYSQGQYAKAVPLFLEASRIRKETVGEKHADYAGALSNLTVLYTSLRQYDKAEPLGLEAVRIRKDTLGEKHPEYAFSLNVLARLYKYQGQYGKAEPLLRQAVIIMQDYLEESAAVQSEADQLRNIDVTRHCLFNYLELENIDAAALYSAAFRWHGAVTARQTFVRTANRSSPQIQRLVDELQDRCRQMNLLVQSPPKAMAKTEQVKLLKDLEDQRDALERKIASQSAEFAAYQSRLQRTPADLQKNLPEDTALLDFLVHGSTTSVFVVKGKSIVHITLDAGGDLKDDIEVFVNEASLKRTRPVMHDADISIKLRERIWKPLEPHLKGVKRVLICPDGPLCRMPFAVLPGADPKNYLIEELSIIVVPVPQMLPELLVSAAKPIASSPSLLAVGDVNFDGDPAPGEPKKAATASFKRSGETLNWKPLPGTKGEVEAIEALFRKLPQAAVKNLAGSEATGAALEREMPRQRFVHLATHGFFQAPQLVRNFASNASASDETILMPSIPPGLSSGIVCAGANKPTFQNSGILTALQIGELDLRNVELVVLSACETGLGELSGGEGVLGLQRAFQMAGARSTISSLWSVPDRSTAELMKRFYANRLEKGLATAEALREAQLWVLNNGDKVGAFAELKPGKRNPPLYWAAFTFAGDWR